MKQVLMMLILVLGLLFWGWSTEVLWLGALLSVILLLGFVFKGKYHFEASSFYQIANLGGLVVVAIFAVYWLDDRASKAIMPTLGLLPLALLPLMLMQYLSKQGKAPASALLFFQRGKQVNEQWFDVSTLFLFTCLFSAGAIPHEGTAYFTGVSALVLVLFIVLHHNKHAISNVWIVLVFLVAETMAIGFVYGMNDLQSKLEAKINAWILSYNDGSKTSSAMGEVGRLKLSNRIVFRVQADDDIKLPLLLREGSYQRYQNNEWYGGSWQDIDVENRGERWILQPNIDSDIESGRHLRVYQSFESDKFSLALPQTTTFVAGLMVDGLRIKQGDRVQAQGLPAFAAFDVYYQPDIHVIKTSKRSDFDIPKAEAKSIANFVKSHDLYQTKWTEGEARAVNAVKQIFNNEFHYSTWLKYPNTHKTALAYFLEDHKAGHCEYFATATVLILRELGIPARYVVGYSVSEKNGDLYVVRGRDAHAWAEVLIEGRWQVVDNTPANWFAIESADDSTWFGMRDWFSSINFAFKKWRYDDQEKDSTYWYWLLALMFAFLAYRILKRVKTKRTYSGERHKKSVDSEWARFEKDMFEAGFDRRAGETVLHWLRRTHDGQWQDLAQLFTVKHYAKQGLNAKKEDEYKKRMKEVRGQLRLIMNMKQQSKSIKG